MNVFVKTFIICLIVTLSFLFYKFFGTESHSSEIDTINNNMYTFQKDKQEINNQEQIEENTDNNSENTVKEVAKNLHTCYFYNTQGKLIPITREVKGSNAVDSAILLLLKGPLISESQKGIYSEIPSNVDLINTTIDDKKVIVNLTTNFGNGGGFDSIEHRIKQLSSTVKTAAPNKAVYLYIDGKEVEYLGGDGVYIKQPLE